MKRSGHFRKDMLMRFVLMIWFLRHHLRNCEAGFALAYASLTAIRRTPLPVGIAAGQ